MNYNTDKYIIWLKSEIKKIDNLLEDYMDTYLGTGELDDEDIQNYIAKLIIKILEEHKIEKYTKLYTAIKEELIENYVEFMFRQWYTGEKTKDYYIMHIDNKLAKKGY